MIGRIQERPFTQALTGGALTETVVYGENGTIKAIYINFSTNITETVTITRLSRLGTNYNILLDTKTLNSESSYIFHPDWDVVLIKGDSIKIQVTNANTTGTAYGLCHFEGGVNE